MAEGDGGGGGVMGRVLGRWRIFLVIGSPGTCGVMSHDRTLCLFPLYTSCALRLTVLFQDEIQFPGRVLIDEGAVFGRETKIQRGRRDTSGVSWLREAKGSL